MWLHVNFLNFLLTELLPLKNDDDSDDDEDEDNNNEDNNNNTNNTIHNNNGNDGMWNILEMSEIQVDVFTLMYLSYAVIE